MRLHGDDLNQENVDYIMGKSMNIIVEDTKISITSINR